MPGNVRNLAVRDGVAKSACGIVLPHEPVPSISHLSAAFLEKAKARLHHPIYYSLPRLRRDDSEEYYKAVRRIPMAFQAFIEQLRQIVFGNRPLVVDGVDGFTHLRFFGTLPFNLFFASIPRHDKTTAHGPRRRQEA